MRLVILGAGGHGQVVADLAEQCGNYDSILFLDDGKDSSDGLNNVVGPCCDYVKYIDDETEFYPGFGNNKARLEWEEKLLSEGAALAKIIHPLAYISPKAEVAEGCVVMPYAVVNTGCIVEKACIINCGAILDHGSHLEPGCHLAPAAIVKAENHIAGCTKVDSGEIIPVREFYDPDFKYK